MEMLGSSNLEVFHKPEFIRYFDDLGVSKNQMGNPRKAFEGVEGCGEC